jgi:hypothetical protein
MSFPAKPWAAVPKWTTSGWPPAPYQKMSLRRSPSKSPLIGW